MPTPPVYPPGTTINDRYELQAKLGSDGFVYEAHDRHLNKQVALKVLHPEQAGVTQPWGEAQRLEHLRSVFLVDVINADVIISSDIRFIVTPLVEGGDLEVGARPVGLSVHEAVRCAQQVAAGVGRIHAAGMVHRDIKPANVLLTGDSVLVSDLEFCELLDDSGRAGRNGSFCTIAPETADDNGYCTVLSDVYSIGATAFFLMSGRYPVDHRLPKKDQQLLIMRGEIRRLRVIAPHVSQALGTVIRKALNLDPSKRYASAEALGNALAHAARETRNWRRVEHPGHVHCIQGEPFHGRAAVDVCAIPDSSTVQVVSRNQPTNRRIRGVADVNVSQNQLPKYLQKLVKSLA